MSKNGSQKSGSGNGVKPRGRAEVRNVKAKSKTGDAKKSSVPDRAKSKDPRNIGKKA